jgi:hypothetical protein
MQLWPKAQRGHMINSLLQTSSLEEETSGKCENSLGSHRTHNLSWYMTFNRIRLVRKQITPTTVAGMSILL